MPTKLKAPSNASSVSHGGEEYLVKGGYVHVPDHAVGPLLNHGYLRVEAESDDELVSDEDDVEAINPDNMTKKELITFLREHKVSFPKPTTVGELRGIVSDYLKEHPDADKPEDEE